jgi:hypothetical protein
MLGQTVKKKKKERQGERDLSQRVSRSSERETPECLETIAFYVLMYVFILLLAAGRFLGILNHALVTLVKGFLVPVGLKGTLAHHNEYAIDLFGIEAVHAIAGTRVSRRVAVHTQHGMKKEWMIRVSRRRMILDKGMTLPGQ